MLTRAATMAPEKIQSTSENAKASTPKKLYRFRYRSERAAIDAETIWAGGGNGAVASWRADAIHGVRR